VISHCKDELALGETHTYNPPHRKWFHRRCNVYCNCRVFPEPVGWVCVPPMFEQDPGLAWVIPGCCRRFSRKS